MTFSPEEIRFSMQACAIGLSAAILGCDAPTSATPEEPISAADTTGPVINNVVLNHNPNPTVPLAAILSLSTDEPAEVTVRVEDGERVWDAISSEQPATEHSLIVLGLRAGRTHSITAVAVDASGNTSNSRALALETPPLPDAVPRPEVLISQPGRMEPGVTLFNVIRTGDDGEAVPDYRMLVIVDDQGEVIWYYRDYHGATDARRLSNGNILYLGGDHRAAEIDMLGNVIQAWHSNQADPETIMPGSIHVDTATFHHEVAELPSGNLLTLGRSARVIDDFPSSESDPNAAPAPATVVGDTIVEFTRDGTVVHEWSLLEILDPYRIGYGSLRSTFPPIQQHYNQPGEPIARDWTHSNAVSHDPSDDSFIVSVRYQDAVVKLDRQTGALKWILGTHDHWKEPWQQYLLEP
ncbi:MAG: aryl-sulfate sulfotransferase, partial [Rhodospirillaceae bacterium]|nr:aryl-sulfate sulfotransferase [Rhodospirillaceae bacterium]